jgi:hypothetical protein
MERWKGVFLLEKGQRKWRFIIFLKKLPNEMALFASVHLAVDCYFCKFLL